MRRVDRSPLLASRLPGLIGQLRRDSVVRTSGYIMANTVITSVLGYGYWIVAAREYSPAAVGLGAALVSAITIVSAASILGLQSSLIQNLPKRADPSEWSLTITTAFIVSAGSTLVVATAVLFVLPGLSSRFSPLVGDWRYAVAFVGGSVLTTLLTMLDYTSIAERRTRNMVVRNSLFTLVKVPILLLPPLIAVGALGVFGSWTIAQVMTAVVGYLLVRRLRSGAYVFRLRGLLAHARSLVRNMLGHHLINLGSYLPIYILPIFVTAEVSPADNAYFYATWRIASFLFLIPPAVGMALFAEGSHSGDAASRARKALGVVLGLMVPIGIVGSLGAHLILSSFGAAYADHGTTLMRLFLLGGVPDSVNNILLNTLRVQRRLAFASAVTIVDAVLTLGLGWLLLGSMGVNGGAVAIIIGETAGCAIIAADALRRRAHRRRTPRDPVPEAAQ